MRSYHPYPMADLTPGVTLREMTSRDLPEVARVHVAAFGDSLLSKLGTGIVERYYAWQVSGVNTVRAEVAIWDSHVAGFAVGGEFKDSLRGFFNGNRSSIAMAVLSRPHLLADPLLWERLALLRKVFRRARRRRLKIARGATPVASTPASEVASAGESDSRPSALPPFNVLAIAIHPDRRRLGVGRRLMQDQELTAASWGRDRMILTVNNGNKEAVEFYLRCGWELASANGTHEVRMQKRLGAVS